MAINICIPLEKAIQNRNMKNWEYVYADPAKMKYVYSALDIIKNDYLKFDLIDFYNLYIKNEKPIFRAIDHASIFDYYADEYTSLEKLDSLLTFQINDYEMRCQFLNSVVSWFNKLGVIPYNGHQNLKIQTIIVVGPPNCGKTYFWNCVTDLALNVGQFARINNRNNAFSLQDIVNRRIIVGNEMNIESGAVEDLKKICEGIDCNIRVKNKPDANFFRTPIVITTNENGFLLSVHPHFDNVRTYTYHWNALPNIDYNLKPAYPLAFFKLLSRYNIMF